ncbi:anti-sigma F factor antagonist [Haloimpatiens sp. FM7330]|uniref:anti-sigma F factor antagonist n=1 Tax=Haloimpatiens sp. FM7330 TaxID=3298610 RepID=UPI003628FD3D
MYLKFEKIDDKIVTHMIGELDHHSAQEVRNKIDDRLDREGINKLVIDFDEVTFMDSSGIGVVIGRYKKVKLNKGNIGVCNVKGSVERVFQLSGMFKLISIYDSIEEALSNI